MGVNPVGNQKYFTFDGETSKKYNTHITGEGVFNAPERAVEMINIPNRNGAFALDQGYFENIELTYNASIAADTTTEYAQAVSDLRNWLCSKKGYCRLEDEYNPNEYRMAVYKSGLEVDSFLTTVGEFNIVFDCKPQRFLTSGETAVNVVSGATITNPTLFESHPMLEVTGYGSISIEGQNIVVHNEPIGDIVVRKSTSNIGIDSKTITVDTQYANVGDIITFDRFDAMREWKVDSGTITWGGATSTIRSFYNIMGDSDNHITFTFGTASTETNTKTYDFTTSAYGAKSATMTLTVAYDGDHTFTITVSQSLPTHISQATNTYSRIIEISDAILHSSQTLLGNPLYIDLDIGEAYKIEGGSAVSVNNGVQIPAELPTLKPGSNTITYDNTFTAVSLIPRWWKV